jgi:hypothetical protein
MRVVAASQLAAAGAPVSEKFFISKDFLISRTHGMGWHNDCGNARGRV